MNIEALLISILAIALIGFITYIYELIKIIKNLENFIYWQDNELKRRGKIIEKLRGEE